MTGAAHSVRPPSSAARRIQCAASRAAEALYPDTESDAAREGTAAHTIAAEMVADCARALTPFPARYVGRDVDGVHVTDEMYQGAALYAHHVRGIMQSTGVFDTDSRIGIETRLSISAIHLECWGTPDFWLYDEVGGNVYVTDFKFGHGLVEPFENWQLIYYAVGVLQLLQVDPNRVKIHLSIVQPRAWHANGPCRTWTLAPGEIVGYLHTAMAAEQLEDVYATGPQCRYCRAALACEALHRTTLSILDFSGNATLMSHTPETLGYEMTLLWRAEKLLAARKDAAQAQVQAIIESGGAVPGCGTQPTWSRRDWSVSVDELRAIQGLFGVPLLAEKPCTPQQAIAKGYPEDFVKKRSETHKTGSKIVPKIATLAHQIFYRGN